MRIIAGLARGMTLKAPPGLTTRPTSDKVRGALFSKLQGQTEGAVFVDFFAGSGLVGLEAASRGAAEVIFIENDRVALRVIRENIAQFTKKASASQVRFQPEAKDVGAFLQQANRVSSRWDIVWADPPYQDASFWLSELLKHLPAYIDLTGVFVIEGPAELRKQNWELEFPAWELIKANAFGKTVLLEFRLRDR